MADIELAHLGDRRDRRDIVIGQAVAGMDLDAVLRGECRRVGQAAQFLGLGLAGKLGIAARVQLDDRRTEAECSLDLARIGFDKQGDADLRPAELADEMLEMIVLAGRARPASVAAIF